MNTLYFWRKDLNQTHGKVFHFASGFNNRLNDVVNKPIVLFRCSLSIYLYVSSILPFSFFSLHFILLPSPSLLLFALSLYFTSALPPFHFSLPLIMLYLSFSTVKRYGSSNVKFQVGIKRMKRGFNKRINDVIIKSLLFPGAFRETQKGGGETEGMG